MRFRFNYIDKIDFLTVFLETRITAYKAEIIQNSFTVTRLVLFNLN
jgi:hypothetical protein